MIVNARERRSPVIHCVEEPVLQNEISSIPDCAYVVGGSVWSGLLVPNVCGCSEAAGNLAAHDQRQAHDRIDDAAEHANHGEAAAAMESVAIWPTPPTAVRRPVQRLVHEMELEIDAAPLVRV